jgi:peptidoglycan/xylan/chitin deacetylase (PgdA/CDA1 family)
VHLIVFGLVTTLASMLVGQLSGVGAWWGIPVIVPVHLLLMYGLYNHAPSWFCNTTSRAAVHNERRIALTFDDGPHPDVTPKILAILADKRVTATFFLIGRNVRRYPEIARAVALAGHEIGNHSYLHPWHIVGWPRSAVARDTRLAQRTIERAANVAPIWYRPPIGFRNIYMRRVLRGLNLRLVNFTFRSFDTVARRPQFIVDRVLSRNKPGAIVLLHDGADRDSVSDRAALAAALPVLIDRLRTDGYEFQTLTDLLRPHSEAEDKSPVLSAQATVRLRPDRRPIILPHEV